MKLTVASSTATDAYVWIHPDHAAALLPRVSIQGHVLDAYAHPSVSHDQIALNEAQRQRIGCQVGDVMDVQRSRPLRITGSMSSFNPHED